MESKETTPTSRPTSSSSTPSSDGGITGEAFKLKNLSKKWGYKLWSLTLDLPGEKVNVLGKKVIEEFQTLIPKLNEMAKNGEIEAVVLQSGKEGNFIAGADINLIKSAKTAEESQAMSAEGQQMLNTWEDLPFPTVIAINGSTMGGGCELSLASSAIVMSDHPKAKIGLPEVLLGIIPGMGGCVRLPTKIGIANALDMILTGKTLNGKRAARMGLADGFLPKENFEESVYQWTKKNLSKLKKRKRIAKKPKLGGMGGAMGTMLEMTPPGRAVIFGKARTGVLSKTKGHYPAPLEAIDVIRGIGTGYEKRFRGTSRDRVMAREAQGFGKCASTDISTNLIRLFFMNEAIKKSNGLPEGKKTKAIQVKTAGVLGAGVMGGGVAQLFAAKNVSTRMKDITSDALKLGIQSAQKIFKKKVKRRQMTKREYLQKMNHIAPVLGYEGFGNVDCVVEAVIEKMEIKKSVVNELEGHVKDNCVIATNTSSLSVTEMASGMKKPERFAGMHFFNPVHRMPLIEVIRGEKSSDEAVTTVFEFSKKLGKIPIVVKDSPGFLVNRILGPYLNESTWLLNDGAPIEEMDRAILNFGMPMGPMELIDEVGVDVAEKVGLILHDAFGDRLKPPGQASELVKEKRLGKKNGKGMYLYSNGGFKKELDPRVYKILNIKPKPGTISAEEIVERCILPMVNEASRCLAEGVVGTPEEVDMGMIMGTGFPPFRGGLLRYADTLGPGRIVERLRKYESRFGSRFAPDASLVSRVESNKLFYGE